MCSITATHIYSPLLREEGRGREGEGGEGGKKDKLTTVGFSVGIVVFGCYERRERRENGRREKGTAHWHK